MNKTRKILSIFLLLAVFSVFNGSEFFHNHSLSKENGKPCSACLLAKTMQSTDTGTQQICIIPAFFELLNIPHSSDIITSLLPESHSGRAPPSLT